MKVKVYAHPFNTSTINAYLRFGLVGKAMTSCLLNWPAFSKINALETVRRFVAVTCGPFKLRCCDINALSREIERNVTARFGFHRNAALRRASHRLLNLSW